MNPASTRLILHNLFSKLTCFIPQCMICFCECCYCMSLLSVWELPGKFRAVLSEPGRAGRQMSWWEEVTQTEQHTVDRGVRELLAMRRGLSGQGRISGCAAGCREGIYCNGRCVCSWLLIEDWVAEEGQSGRKSWCSGWTACAVTVGFSFTSISVAV